MFTYDEQNAKSADMVVSSEELSFVSVGVATLLAGDHFCKQRKSGDVTELSIPKYATCPVPETLTNPLTKFVLSRHEVTVI